MIDAVFTLGFTTKISIRTVTMGRKLDCFTFTISFFTMADRNFRILSREVIRFENVPFI